MKSKKQQHKSSSFPLPKKKKSSGIGKWIAIVWIGFTATILGIAALFFATSQGLLGEMPDVKQLENPDIYSASEIISSDGVVLGKFELEKTDPVTFSQLPPYLVYALQAKEDERFREHSGIDLRSILRAVRFGGDRGGGSTISQQLAKLLFTKTPSQNKIKRVIQKLKEWVVAVSLEKRYTKEELITMYFNKFDFTHNAHGVEMASKVYFNKHTNELTLPEAAMFVAMLEAPVANNPLRNKERAKRRRDVVLKKMYDDGYIDKSVYQNAIDTPIITDYHPIKKIVQGNSEYYKYFLRKQVDEYLKEYEKETGRTLDLFRDGLKIYVTLNSHMQKYAEEAMKEHLTHLQRSFDAEQKRNPNYPFYRISKSQADKIILMALKRSGRYQQLKDAGISEDSIVAELKRPIKMSIFSWNGEKEVMMSPWDSIRYHKQIAQSGLMSMEPLTGDIKAWVGGIDWSHFKYDHVKQGKRQVGSTFKPFVYAASIIDLNYTPCTTISNASYSLGNWHVKGRGGMLPLKDALAYSQNAVAARLIQNVGVDRVIALARDMGVTSDIPRNNTIALGSSDISIYEMVGAYSTFANFGNYIKPHMIWRIEDANGRVIKEVKDDLVEIMDEKYAYTMITLMEGVASYGTASGELRRRGISGVDIAGKTGTTNNNSDGWFIGIVPQLSTGVWVGWESRATHFLSTGEGQGAKMALPIWAIFMKKVWADKELNISPNEKFAKPTGWTNSCDNLHGGGNYGYGGGLRTIDEIRSSDSVRQEAPKRENINENINTSDEVDFNQ